MDSLREKGKRLRFAQRAIWAAWWLLLTSRTHVRKGNAVDEGSDSNWDGLDIPWSLKRVIEPFVQFREALSSNELIEV